MANERLVRFTKAWNYKDGGYGEKPFYFNPDGNINGLDECKLRGPSGQEIDCIKIYYGVDFITLVGTIENFYEKCREVNAAFFMLNAIYQEGLTIKQFIQQGERLNLVEAI